MKLATSLASVLALASCSRTPDAQRAVIPGTHVRLTAPGGHESASGETGYRWTRFDARLVVRERPMPYASAVKALSNGIYPGMGPGTWLLAVEDVELGGRPAKLASFRQESSRSTRRAWLALVGDAESHSQLEASVVERHADEFGPQLESALRGAEWDPSIELDPFVLVPWTIAPPAGLVHSPSMDGTLSWTEAAGGSASAWMMVWTVAAQPGVDGPAACLAEVARQAQARETGVEHAVESSQRADVAKRLGHETVITATQPGAPPRLLVLHAIALAGGGHLVFRSECRSEERATWLPRFRAAAASWRPKSSR